MRFVKTAESIFDIPSGFTRVEFLESTGTQYIDTNTEITPTTTVLIDASLESYVQWSNSCGGVPSARGYFCLPFGWTDSNTAARSIYGTDTVGTGEYDFNYTLGKRVKILYNDNKKLYIDNVHVFTFNYDKQTPPSTQIFQFGRYSNACGAKFYGVKIWDNGYNSSLIADFIPCIDPLGRACLYDLVGKKAYYNQGTGEFTVGRQIIPVEYLEGTGTQYIDTMIKSVVNMSVKAKFNLLDVSAKAVFGSYSGSASNGVGVFFGTAGSNLSGKVYCNNTNVAVIPDLTLSTNTDYEIEMSGTTLVVNGSTYTSATTADNNYNMLLFARSNNGTVERQIAGKIYYFTIKDNGTLVRNMIPCKDENNVGFMFDTLSGTVYENAGTGAFVVGQNKYNMKLRLIRDNILPTGYTQVEYIEATNSGTIEYAVGNYRLTDTTDWEITFTASAPSNNWVMGQPSWIGVHYRKDATTSNLPMVGITNSSTAGSQCYVDYTDDEKITLALKGTDVYANGVKVGSITRVSAPATQTKYGLFAYKDINQDLPNLRISSARIYRLKIWNSGVLVQDLIPAIKDGVAGFYERVNKTFIEKESNSTSDFTTGKPILPMVRFIKDIVPAGYKTVNYLESTGTQYIDTGFKPNTNTRTVGRCYFNSFVGSNADYIFGVFSSPNNYGLNVGSARQYFNVPWGSSSGIQLNGLIPQRNKDYEFDISNTGYLIDGQSYGTISAESVNSTRNMYLFWSNGTSASGMNGRIYYLHIYDNNTLVRNFIPVIRLLDNKAGMWDTVTKQFYTTPVGNFITG